MKLLLLGADGQVGHALRLALAADELRPATRSGTLPGGFDGLQADLADGAQLTALIERERPDWIINAAAYTAVDRAEDEPELANRINGDALADIGAAAHRIGSRVLHYSTDYVFPGTPHAAWREGDNTAPVNHYGLSKLRGEIALRESGARHLILRTAWVYGPRGNNFLRTMLRLAAERPQLAVVADQFGTPTTAQLIAAVSVRLITELQSAADADARWGTYHLTAAGHTSWHQFASVIFDQAFSAGLIARRPEVKEIVSADYPTRARRPNWSVLDNGKIESNFGLHLPDWQVGLATTLSMVADERSRWPNPH